MGHDATAEHLAHAAELDRRDAAIAHELETIAALAGRAGAVRDRVREIREALARIPRELGELGARRGQTEADATRARRELEAAEARLAELERSRRRKTDEIARVRSERSTAVEQLADAETRLARLATREAELHEERRVLGQEAAGLARRAAEIAAELRRTDRVTERAAQHPGVELEELEEWGAQVRSALFVARGTLETERERVVAEANALGAAVLGESLGASSVAVLRRRIEAHLA